MLSLSIDHSITAADPSVWKAPLVPLFSSKHKKGVRKGSVRMGNTNQRLRRPPPLFFAFDHQNRRVINNQIRNAPNRPPWVRLGRAIDRNFIRRRVNMRYTPAQRENAIQLMHMGISYRQASRLTSRHCSRFADCSSYTFPSTLLYSFQIWSG
jgi:hypothetical protein